MTRKEIWEEWTTIEFLHRLQWLHEKQKAENFDAEQRRIIEEAKANARNR